MKFIVALSVVVCFCSSSFAQTMVADDLQFPYEALVLNEEAAVRSGPAMVHYSTDRLAQGTKVDVYRHDPGGWCAIRPPEGSFSLVPESAIEMVEEGIGRVTVDSAQAWVGTRLGVVENPLWQVKLKQNELVDILGEVSWPNPEGHSTIWYQVAAPAGEFRWIQMADLQLPSASTQLPSPAVPSQALSGASSQPMLSPAAAVNAAAVQSFSQERSLVNNSGMPTQIPAAQTSVRPIVPKQDDVTRNLTLNQTFTANLSQPMAIQDRQVQPAILQSPNEISSNMLNDTIPDSPARSINSGWRPAKRDSAISSSAGKYVSNQAPNKFTPPSIPNRSSSFVSATAQASTQPSNQSYSAPVNPYQGTRMASANLDIAPEFAEGIAASRLSRQSSSTDSAASGAGSGSPGLQRLELELTNEMLKEPGDWKLQDLMLKTEVMRDQARDPLETQHANRLLDKLKKCQQIRTQYREAYNSNAAANLGNPDVGRSLSRRAVGTGVDTEIEFGATYDAYGWLNELVRSNGSDPSTYVLQDDDGKVTHHITGSPGLNLNRYLKSKVGIIGQRGFHQQLNLNHVTAERVIELRERR